MESIAQDLTKSLTSTLDAGRLEWEGMIANISDPLAREIEWMPLLKWGSSIKSHDIFRDAINGNLEFRISKGMRLFVTAFVWLWIFIDIAVVSSLLSSDTFTLADTIVPLLIASVFTAIGLLTYKYFLKTVVFDKQAGYFYKGKPLMAYGIIDPNDPNIVPLSSIHAIQVVREWVVGKNTRHQSYEINLVLHDKKRINVVDHANLDAIRADSKELGEYLRVPVWGV